MAKTLQFRRDTTTNLASVTGAVGELFVDTTKDTVVVMDGSTAGGFPLAKESDVPADLSDLTDTTNLIPADLSDLTDTTNLIPADLSDLTDTTNLIPTSLTDLGITDGTNGQVLTTNGSGGFTFTTATGGGGDTGDFTFSANTITLPVNTDGVLNVTGNVSTSTNFSWSYSNSTELWTNNQDNTTSRASMFINAGDEMNNFSLSIGNNLNPVSDDPAAIALSQLPVGTVLTLSGSTYSRVCTLATQFTFNGSFWAASVSDVSGSTNSFSVKALSYPVEIAVPTNFSYTFEADGTFVTNNAIIGDVLISDDIITPISLDSYGEAQSGTLTVNGDLDILGEISIDGVPLNLEVTPADVGITAINSISAGQSYQSIGLGMNAFNSGANELLPTQAYAFGQDAFKNYSGSQGIAIGFEAAKFLTSGSFGVFIGSGVLSNITSGFLGQYNIAIGTAAGPTSASGSIENTTCVGVSAKTSSAHTTAIGSGADAYGTRSTAIGSGAGSTTRLGTNSTAIGNGANPSTNDVANEITLGNSSIETLRCQVTTITALSDARDKKDITTLNAGLDFVSKLKPVAFTWNMRDGGKVDIEDTGFIAQDLQQTQQDTGITIPGLVYESNPDKLEAAYGKLIPVLVKAIQELSAEVANLKSQINP
jgi:hypothetical protein